MSNKGIIISGGQFNAGQVAVGDHASVRSYGVGEQRELLGKLERLLTEIHAASLPSAQRSELTGVVGRLKEEARSPSPDKTVMEKGLSLIEKTASSVSGVATAIKVVKEVVGLFLLP